jgi:hypothetical protein
LIAAFLLASAAGQIYSSYYARRKFNVEFATPALLKIYSVSAISSILPVLFVNFIQFPIFLSVLVGGVMYLSIYATLVPLARIVTPSELQHAAKITQNIPLLSLIVKPILKYQLKLLSREIKFEELKTLL